MTMAYSRIKPGRRHEKREHDHSRKHRNGPNGPWYSKHAWARQQRFLAKLRKRWRR